METCYSCRGKLEVIKDQPYKYDECGLDVTLYGLNQYRCIDCGEKSVDIPNIRELHRVIGQIICSEQTGFLTGEEIRFLRKDLHLKAKDFARMLGVSPQTFSKWENNKKRIGETPDRLIRSLYFNFVSEQTDNAVCRSSLNKLIGLPGKRANEPILKRFELNSADWLGGLSRLCPQ